MASNLKNELKDQIDGQSNEYKEIIIQNETKKFMEIFNKVFSSDENENEQNEDNNMDDMDDVDGIVEDILNAIVNRVKLILKQQFVRKLLEEEEEEEEDGENKISSEKET